MGIRKCLLTASAVSVMLFTFNAVYAETTVEPFIDDATGSFTVSGSFDNTGKDWINIAIYQGKLTHEETMSLTDDELMSKLRYFKQEEFKDGKYSFSFEFDETTDWYTVFVSGFENENTPVVKEVYYYKAIDAEAVVDMFNEKIKKPSSGFEPTGNDEISKNLTAFLEANKDSYFSNLKYYYGLSAAGKNDVSRSLIGSSNSDYISEILKRVESKSVQRILSEKLSVSNPDVSDCIEFILNNTVNLEIDKCVEKDIFVSANSAFKERVVERMKNTKMDDVALQFRESTVLTQIETVTNTDNVTQILKSASESLGIDISKYNSFKSKSSVNKQIANKNFDTLEEMIEKIDSLIDKSKTTVESGGSSGGTGGGGSHAAMSKPVSVPGNGEIQTKPEDENEFFADFTRSHWAYTAVDYLRNKGIISGYTDGSFRPGNNITRAEFIKLVSVAFNINYDNAESDFKDVSGDEWFACFVAAAYQHGIVTGDENGCFNPADNITRQDAAVIVYRTALFAGKAFEIDSATEPFADSESIADYAANPVSILQTNGIINGSDGYFYPGSFATRAEMSQLIYALLMKM